MYFRRSSLLVPYNTEYKILLQHRTKDAPHYADYWGFFGGEIDVDETPEEALIREAKEELGLDITEPKLFKRYDIEEDEGKRYERFVYLSPLTQSVAVLRKQQKEGADLDYFSPEDIKSLKFNEYNLRIIDDIADFLSTQ